MYFSPYHLILALGSAAGAALLFVRFRGQAEVSRPAGVLCALAGVYFACRCFIPGLAESPVVSWGIRGILVLFLIYMLLCWNNMKAVQNPDTTEKDGKDDADPPRE